MNSRFFFLIACITTQGIHSAETMKKQELIEMNRQKKLLEIRVSNIEKRKAIDEQSKTFLKNSKSDINTLTRHIADNKKPKGINKKLKAVKLSTRHQ